MTLPANTTRKQALAALKQARIANGAVKLYRTSGIYTQPGRGIVSFVSYEIR